MEVFITNQIEIHEPSDELIRWVNDNLIVTNPVYTQLKITGKEDLIQKRHVPSTLNLFSKKRGGVLVIPFGCLYSIWGFIKNCNLAWFFNENGDISIKDDKPTLPLFDYQEEAIQAMIKAKGGILQAPCGTGKSFMGVEIIRRLGKKALWLCHTGDLLRQAKKDMEKQYPNIKIGLTTAGKLEIGEDVTISTVQTMDKIDPSFYEHEFDVVICDECFPGETKIMTLNGFKKIKDIKLLDYVLSYNHENNILEYKKVVCLFIKKTNCLLEIKFANNKKILCTKNHPFYTKRGYIKAEELNEDDYVLYNLWQGSGYNETSTDDLLSCQKKWLRSLQYGMFNKNKSKEKLGKIDSREQKKIQRKYEKIERIRIDEKKGRIIKGCSFERGDKNQVEQKTERKKICIKGWEWNVNTSSSKEVVRCIKKNGYRLYIRTCCANKNAKRSWVSYVLQDRYSYTFKNVVNRSGWGESFNYKSENCGQKEGKLFEWIRVEDIKIQESRNTRKRGKMHPENIVYNIEVEDNNNYFANNILVHNCAHVCGSPTQSKMFQRVINNIKARYKFGLTATPDRSDGMIKSMFAYIGVNPNGKFESTYKVPKEAVRTIVAEHKRFEIDSGYNSFNMMKIYNYSGQIEFNKLITELSTNHSRTDKIIDNIVKCHEEGRKQAVLSLRVEHCEEFVAKLNKEGIKAVLCTGKTKDKDRNAILNQEVEWDVIVSTFALFKEGISINELDTMHLTLPVNDKATTVQCAGRVERYMDNKKQPIVFDYVDVDIPYCEKKYTNRRRSLKSRF